MRTTKKCLRANAILLDLLKAIKKKGFRVLFIILLMLVTKVSAITSVSLYNDDKNRVIFKVLKNDRIIGIIEIVKQESNNTITYNLNCEIKAKFVLKVKVIGKETSVFENGVLVYSSLYRTLNGKVKVDQSLVYKNGDYCLRKPDQDMILNLKEIQNNLVTLYFREPKDTKKVYCDYQSELIDVQCICQGVYKVKFSRNKYNTFYYENGKCVKIEAVSSLFQVTLISA